MPVIPPVSDPPGMKSFGEATRRWFSNTFEAPTEVQRLGWARIQEGDHTLLIAPTGSGKTLAAFLWAIDRLTRLGPDVEPGLRVVYVSPLKALVYDIERNLRAPLAGIERASGSIGVSLRLPTVDVRTGDTTQEDRRRQKKTPGEILVTTPESLFLILGSQARETLRTVEWVIVDEVHALAPTKRGAHLAVSLERLARIATLDPQRIGLSATARPAEEVARFLGGDRSVSIVDTQVPPRLDLQVVVPVDDMTRPTAGEAESHTPTDRSADGPESIPLEGVSAVAPEGSEGGRGTSLLMAEEEETTRQYGIWPAVYPKLLELILAHRTTIVFVNSRGLCERLAQQLNELADEALVRAHHGSLAHDQRREIEEALKGGRLRAIVATSSLELGIDMGSVDLVILVESPGSVARGLQRVGRAGHGVGETSIGRIFPKASRRSPRGGRCRSANGGGSDRGPGDSEESARRPGPARRGDGGGPELAGRGPRTPGTASGQLPRAPRGRVDGRPGHALGAVPVPRVRGPSPTGSLGPRRGSDRGPEGESDVGLDQCGGPSPTAVSTE